MPQPCAKVVIDGHVLFTHKMVRDVMGNSVVFSDDSVYNMAKKSSVRSGVDVQSLYKRGNTSMCKTITFNIHGGIRVTHIAADVTVSMIEGDNAQLSLYGCAKGVRNITAFEKGGTLFVQYGYMQPHVVRNCAEQMRKPKLHIGIPRGRMIYVRGVDGHIVINDMEGTVHIYARGDHTTTVGRITGNVFVNSLSTSATHIASVHGNLEIAARDNGDVIVADGVVSELRARTGGVSFGTIFFGGKAHHATVFNDGSGSIHIAHVDDRVHIAHEYKQNVIIDNI